MADCDAGNLDQDIFKTSAALDTAAANNKLKSDKKSKQSKKVTNIKKKTISKKNTSKDKWTNYSQTFLKKKFNAPTSPSQEQSPNSSPQQSASPSSPRDVNEISLHISLLDNPTNLNPVDNFSTSFTLMSDSTKFLWILQF